MPNCVRRACAAVLGLLFVNLTVSSWAAEPESLPNIVIIYADDLGYGDLGCYGGQPSVTPHLDQLAKQGARFTDFYAAQPVCSASRAALLTGCYPNRLSIVGALSPRQNYGLSHREMTLAQLLKQQNYATAIYGKWHLGHHVNFLPTTFGFDDYLGLPYSNDMSPAPEDSPGVPPKTQFPPLPLIDGTKVVATTPDQSQLTTQYTERAVKFIAEHRERPFLLYVPHSMPHVPIRVSDKFRNKTGQGLYADVIAEIDWSVGQILAALDQHQLAERTLVIFSSDNGPWKIYGNHGGSAGPLRESKGTVYEGGIRVPCLARWPGRIAAGTVIHEPAIMIDWFPTIAGLTGTKLPEQPIDGHDIWPLLTQPAAKNPHDAFFFYYRDGELQAMRLGSWKLLFPHDVGSVEGAELGRDGAPGKGVRRKIGLELYDLSNDLGEQHNLAESRPEIVATLQSRADQMREDLGDRLQGKTGKGVRTHEEFPAASP
ncbi:sulfatase-like hydrolase/transferase [Schlesneria paludicola]|uniref:sulfatase-like hydrolase/transferase n=1 Tax=Schlesneria paludicola TaxID=360056 RepID=UPI00029B0FC5|nr:sulfatase-like hydrolase/transferase [Schlesneria paludicola]